MKVCVRNSRRAGRTALLTLSILFCITCAAKSTPPVAAATPTYPDLQRVVRPNPEPTLPNGFKPFAPPVSAASPSSAAPAFAEWTRTAAPDQTLVMTGHQFSRFTGGDAGKDARFLVFGQTTTDNPTLKDAKLQRFDPMKVAVTLDAALPDSSMYFVWAKSEAGYGFPVAINRTEAWWLGPVKAARGTTASVFGRNLSHNLSNPSAPGSSWVYIKPANGAGVWAAVTAANPYKVDFTVPSELADGDYEVWIHNGHGAGYGWSGPLALTINDGQRWNAGEFNVRNFGARGDGVTDDEAAIQATLDAAQSRPGATVYLPAGTYMVSRGFHLPANVRWRGDGKANTFIKLHRDFVRPSGYDDRRYSLFFDSSTQTVLRNVEIRDLTLDANNNLNGYLDTLIHLRGQSEVRFTNVAIKAAGYKFFDFHISSLVFLKNCDITGTGGFMGDAEQVFVDNCNFYGTNDANTLFESWGGEGLSITNSTARDYDNTTPTGWAQGRFVYGNGVWGSNRNIYVGNNRTFDLSVRPGYSEQNTGEQFMWEGNNTYHSGTPVASSSNTVTFDRALPEHGDGRYEAVIVAGVGVGQHRRIVGFAGSPDTLRVSPEWQLPPDSSSTVIVAAVIERAIVYQNNIDGKSDYATRATASSGVQPYGNSYDFIADSNIIREVQGGISSWATDERDTIQPCYFNLYVNNDIQNSRLGALSNVEYARDMTRDPGTSYLGNTFRRNNVGNLLERGFMLTGTGAPPGGQLDMTVLEHNTGANLPVVIDSAARPDHNTITNTVIYKNRFDRGTANRAGSRGVVFTRGRLTAALRENTWSNFENVYSGVPPGFVLEAPQRVVEVDGTAAANGNPVRATLPLWNSGTARGNWNATDDAAWLTIVTQNGALDGESSAGQVAFDCNPANLAAGTHTATITVAAGDQQQKLTVLFTVGASTPITQTQTPYPGRPHALPGTIQAEEFDHGGEGVAYHDGDAQNIGNQFRQTGVDITQTPDAGGGYIVGWAYAGEWLEYTVDVSTTGTYTFEARVASNGTGGAFHLEVDGLSQGGGINIPNTGGWHIYQTVTRSGINLSAGTHVLRLAMDSNGQGSAVGNFNHFSFLPPAARSPFRGAPAVIPGLIEAEDFDNGGEGVTYHDLDTNNNGGAYRSTAVDTWCDGTPRCGVGWVGAGEWLEYTVDVRATGTYTLEASVGAPATGGTFHVEVDGTNRTGALRIPNTGDWRVFRNVVAPGLQLSAGRHVLRVVMDTPNAAGGVADFNSFRFVSAAPTSTAPIAHWKFDEGGGALASDSSGNNHTGTLSGGTTWVAGRSGGALGFDGVDDRVEVPHSPNLSFTSAQSFTLAAWINVPSVPQRWTGVITKSRDANPHYGIWIDAASRWTAAAPYPHDIFGSRVTTGWRHVVVVQNGAANTRKIYVDGAEVGSGAAHDASGRGDLWFGGAKSVNEQFRGMIDDVRIYDRALTASELTGLPAGTTP